MSDLACWNLKQNRGDAVTRGLEAHDGAAVLGLLECNGNRGAIAKWRLPKYPTVVTGPGSKFEARSTQLLVRHDVRIRNRGLINVDTPWRGPQGGRHPGRTFPWATVNLDGQWVVVVVVHMPWSRVRNWRAWSACIRALLKFCGNHDGPIVLMGDWNLTWATRGLGSIRRLARRAGLRRIGTGVRLDYALARGIDLDGDTTGRFGSDHHGTTYERSTT